MNKPSPEQEPELPFPASHPLANPGRTPLGEDPSKPGAASKAGTKPPKPPKPPLPFDEQICAQTGKIVRQVVEANNPKLSEEWYLDVVRGLFEGARADWGQKKLQEQKRAQERAEQERAQREEE